MLKTAEDNGSESVSILSTGEERKAAANIGDEVERLKKQKRTNKTQLTKLYTRLARLMADDGDQESLLDCLETFVDKKFETLEVIESLISLYRKAGDEGNVIKTQAELDAVSIDADRDVASVKAFLATTFKKEPSVELLDVNECTREKRVEIRSSDVRSEKSQKNQSDVGQAYENALDGSIMQGYSSRKSTKLNYDDASNQIFSQKDEHLSIPARLPVDNRTTCAEAYGGIDRKMERVKIPKFSGDKTKFDYFWAAFSTMIDDSNEPSKYKMIRLKSCLERKAEEAIARLGFSDEAYEEAKRTLKRKFGGDRRQIQNYLDELRNMPPLRERSIEDIEKFTDHLVSTIVMLKEQDRRHELKPNSMLYTLLIEKIPRPMLSIYFRWTSEHRREESLVTLRDWMVDETEYRVRAQESREGLSTFNPKKSFENDRKQQRTYTGMLGNGRSRVGNQRRSCACCEKFGHGVWECHKFIKELTVNQRWNLAKEKQLCFRCLTGSHLGKDCNRSKECDVDGCKQTHHKLLHGTSKINDRKERNIQTGKRSLKDKVIPDSPATNHLEQENGAESEEYSYTTTLSTVEKSEKLLSFRTIPVWIKANGKKLKVNAVLDDASSASYMNEEVAGVLGLSVPYEPVAVQVLNDSVETFDSMPVNVSLESCDGNVEVQFSVFTCPRQITGKYRVIDWRCHQKRWPHLKVCNFPEAADDSIVDVLIGQDHIDLHYSRCDVKGHPGEPIARLGPLGWSCIGHPEGKGNVSVQRTSLAYTFFARSQVFDEINRSLKRFWEVDSTGTTKHSQVMTDEEKLAVNKVQQSLKNDGERYQVAVPWRDRHPTLDANYEMAVKRLENTEKRLLRQKSVGDEYAKIISTYQQKGYIRKVDTLKEIIPEGKVWYLPHFPVIRPDKTTTKTRIVFDASAKYRGTSLNDQILPGPKLQNDLFDVLMRFRRYPVALVSDIKEMYLQIRIASEDRSFFRFLWRNLELQRKPDVYEFERIVFGDASAPFRAQFVSQENAKIHKKESPLAAETVKKSTYMDDTLDSVKTDEIAIELYRQLIDLWGKAGMQPQKWLSNSPAVLEVIPIEHRAAEVDLDRYSLPATKTLGLLWLASSDVFSFRIADRPIMTPLTKRTILSKVATIFDPLGFLSPFIVRVKIILQELWSKGLSWDDAIDADVYSRITTWLVELEFLQTITVPRSLQDSLYVKSVMILTFVDASNDAYGAVSYFRIVHDDESVKVTIIASKTRVSPLTPTSTPRLELLAAVLGLRLTVSITRSLGMSLSEVRFWSDSMNVLYWIRGKGRQFRPFVANRIGEIQSQTDPEQWQYIHTRENPADLCSRGASVQELKESELWWQGPTFLKLNEQEWPRKRIEEGNEAAAERKTTCVSFQTTRVSNVRSIGTTWKLDPTNWSNWKQLSHLLAWVLRFVNNIRSDSEKRQTGPLTPEEVEEAERDFIRDAQRKEFSEEYTVIRNNKSLPMKNRLSKLMPKLDDDGLLRCDGRLCYAEFLPYDNRFPIILPRGSWVTKLIVKHYHELGKHITGTNHTLANLYTKFWIIAAREVIRDWENECNECKRRRAKAASQVMAPLPKTRFSPPFQAFSRVSIDYGGPFITIQGRGRRREKRWLCLFTCLLSRAVHLEMAFGLDTDSFLRCLTRMASRRGYPNEIISDRGTNFVGAERELRQLVDQLEKTKIQEKTVDRGIKWQFNPPLAPHFGGVHEIMIRAAKKAIYQILGNADVNDEELMTAFTGAESLLNSRPLTYQTSNPKDDTPLTPNHFLHGQSGGKSAPDCVDTTVYDVRQRWRRVQELITHFWKRWMREWLPMLNARPKWTTKKRDFEIGDVVLAISPDQPRGHWPLGRIIELFPGKDSHVRVAKVQVGNGTLVMPVVKLAPVEIK